MPQIWLTYEEIAHVLHREADEAKAMVVASDLSRRKCSDGLTRVKLPDAMAHEYMLAYTTVFRQSGQTDYMVQQLRGIAAQARRADERQEAA